MRKKEPSKKNIKSAKKVNSDLLIPRLIFIISTLMLVLFGLVMVFSASNAESLNNTGSAYTYISKQAVFSVIGLFVGILIWRTLPFNIWRSNFTWYLFFALFLAMLLTLFYGSDILGAKRWLYIGPLSLQPSEFAKVLIVIVLAKLYSEYKNNQIEFNKFLFLVIICTVGMMAFIAGAQSDLGTTIICFVGIISTLWIIGCPRKVILTIVFFVLISGILLIIFSSYRSSRFQYLDPYNDGANGYGSGYQIIRSYYAISEGGFFGVGLGNSHEKFQYLPEAETDFIFAIICEELGFIGAFFVVTLYLVFLISGLYISIMSKTRFGAAVSGSLVVMIVVQAFINIGCVVGYLPTTGKPLPFISSGGSSMLASLIMVGIILSISEEDSFVDIYNDRRKSFKVVKNSSTNDSFHTISKSKNTNYTHNAKFKKPYNSFEYNKTKRNQVNEKAKFSTKIKNKNLKKNNKYSYNKATIAKRSKISDNKDYDNLSNFNLGRNFPAKLNNNPKNNININNPYKKNNNNNLYRKKDSNKKYTNKKTKSSNNNLGRKNNKGNRNNFTQNNNKRKFNHTNIKNNSFKKNQTNRKVNKIHYKGNNNKSNNMLKVTKYSSQMQKKKK